jgi:DNA-directed RNA polymerase subunit RPC12/RpoP
VRSARDRTAASGVMRALGICPHCSAPISPLRLLRTRRRRPYECPHCEGKAAIAPRSGMRAVVLYVAALAIPLYALDYFGATGVVSLAACLGAALAIPVVFARICRFEAVSPKQAAFKS